MKLGSPHYRLHNSAETAKASPKAIDGELRVPPLFCPVELLAPDDVVGREEESDTVDGGVCGVDTELLGPLFGGTPPEPAPSLGLGTGPGVPPGVDSGDGSLGGGLGGASGLVEY